MPEQPTIEDHAPRAFAGAPRARTAHAAGSKSRRAFVAGALAASALLVTWRPALRAQDGSYPSPTHEGPYDLRFENRRYAAWAIATFEKLDHQLKRSVESQDEEERRKAREEHDAIVRQTWVLYHRWDGEGALGRDSTAVVQIVIAANNSHDRAVRGLDGRTYWIEMDHVGPEYNDAYETLRNTAVPEQRLQTVEKFIETVEADLAEARKRAAEPLPTNALHGTEMLVRVSRAKARMSIKVLEQIREDLDSLRTTGVSEPKDD
jgi:hypothetical protein